MILGLEAEADLAEARAFYERRKLGLGASFLRSVEQVFERIGHLPESHPIVHRDVRRALTRRFPFSVYYRIEAEEVVVLAVIHSRRDPGDWKSRA